ncbi:hypothetical protein C8J56DRAFT_195275 [Mycena floridula]|nr:hypothetical protein C8J56DRAFT_195275 [Mycena floridula]
MTIVTNHLTTTGTVKFASIPPDGEKPWMNINAFDERGRQSSFELFPHNLTVHNLRGKEDSVSLDTAGFQFCSGEVPKHTAFVNDEEIRAEYYPECVEHIKQQTGASRVVIFDHTIRRRRPGIIDSSPETRQPVPSAHVDQTPNSAEARVSRHLPAEEVPELLKHRYQIINLWRPINHAATDWPLALCDFRSVDTTNVMPIELRYPNREPGETYGIQHNPSQKWNYLYGMKPTEFVLIKWSAIFLPPSILLD